MTTGDFPYTCGVHTDWIHEDGDNFPFLHRYEKFVLQPGDCIAGGFAKNALLHKQPRDLDMYFPSQEHYLHTKEVMVNDGWSVKYDTDHATCLTKDNLSIDLVKVHYGTAEQIIDGFDFTICKFAWVRLREDHNDNDDDLFIDDGVDDEGYPFEAVFSPVFFEHLAMKRLVIDNMMVLPLNTFQRMFKYTRYGYNLTRESKIKLISAIHSIPMTSSEDVDALLSHTLYEN